MKTRSSPTSSESDRRGSSSLITLLGTNGPRSGVSWQIGYVLI